MELVLIAISSFFVFIFGEYDILLKTLIFLMIIDYVTGVLCAKYTGTVSSKVGFKGIIKKVCLLAVVIVSVFMDKLIDTDVIRTLVIFYFISNEGISIIENVSKVGISIPEELINVINKLKDKFKK